MSAERLDHPYVAEPGVVYTRSWVVEFMLDLAGYESGENLVDAVAVEPSCGDGEFLEAMILRLSSSCRRQGRPLRDCKSSLIAFDLAPESVAASRQRAEAVLIGCGWEPLEARDVAEGWIREADFLLDPQLDLIGLGGGVDFVIGNPPYVRLEDIDESVVEAYRKRYGTMSGRADLYIGFFERTLGMLAPAGVCAFICADRWMLNQYGSRLRSLITSGGFSVESIIEMHEAKAFHDEVMAYPAITMIRRSESQGRVFVAKVGQDASRAAGELADAARRVHHGESPARKVEVGTMTDSTYTTVDKWFEGSDPWPSGSPERLDLLEHLTAEFPPLEDVDTGTKVGIGVATGADRVFLTKDFKLVERDRLLPVAMARDTVTGSLEWSGHYLINPWDGDGRLVNLAHYPRLGQYFEDNGEVLRSRNVARRNQERWYRTIDKVSHDLTARSKLLIPDIKSVAHPVYDEGNYYPHHNLYYLTSEVWDLKVLGGLLLSRIGQFFVECYAVRMNNGYLRFQAQYLRRIRVPRPESLEAGLSRKLADSFERRDVDAATQAALEAYGIERLPD